MNNATGNGGIYSERKDNKEKQLITYLYQLQSEDLFFIS